MSRVAVLYNVDFEERTADSDAGFSARADVASVAAFAPDCAFNLCESLAGDARLESAVPILLEWMGVPYTGSPPEALSTALYKDRVKERLARVGVPTPPACLMRS